MVIPDPSGPTAVRDSVENAQRLALEKLSKRLRTYYQREMRRYQAEQQRLLDAEQRKSFDLAWEIVYKIFKEYSAERAPNVARLALLAGFPDPNPNSVLPERPLTPVGQKLFDQAKGLRATIDKLDADYAAQAQVVLDAAMDQAGLSASTEDSRIEIFGKELDKRSADEARGAVQQSFAELGLKLADRHDLQVPATSGRTIKIPAESPLARAPEVRSEGIPDGPADRRRLMEHELRIWAGLNRFDLVSDPKDGRDATQEFRTWRSTFKAGP